MQIKRQPTFCMETISSAKRASSPSYSILEKNERMLFQGVLLRLTVYKLGTMVKPSVHTIIQRNALKSVEAVCFENIYQYANCCFNSAQSTPMK